MGILFGSLWIRLQEIIAIGPFPQAADPFSIQELCFRRGLAVAITYEPWLILVSRFHASVSGRYLCILTGGGKGKSHRHLVEQRVTAVDIIRLVAIVVESGIATLKQIGSGVPQLVGF